MKSEDRIHFPSDLMSGCRSLRTIPDDVADKLQNCVRIELKEEDILIYLIENSTSSLTRDYAAEKLQNLCKQG